MDIRTPRHPGENLGSVKQSQRTILLAEADIRVRNALAEYLRECGYRVLEAVNADEVRTHLTRADRPIDIVLADVNLPDEGGFVLASWLRQEHPDLMVILAGNADKAVEKVGDICQQSPHVAKPYDHRVVLERIKRMIATRG